METVIEIIKASGGFAQFKEQPLCIENGEHPLLLAQYCGQSGVGGADVVRDDQRLILINMDEMRVLRFRANTWDEQLRQLRKSGIHCGRRRVWGLMKPAGIRGKFRRKHRATTDSGRGKWIAPNLLQRRFSVDQPNRLWVSDITYIRLRSGWLFLCAIMDLYSRRTVGWSMQTTLSASLGTAALRMAIEHRRPEAGLVLHSDRGSQSVSHEFRSVLRAHKMVSSMSRSRDCRTMPVPNRSVGP